MIEFNPDLFEFDTDKALENIRSMLREFESKYGITTEQMIDQFDIDGDQVDENHEWWDWYDLVAMERNLIEDP